MAETADQLLFSYGTLSLPAVQFDTFGHLPAGELDSLPGYTVDYVDIVDPRLARLSDLAVHPIIRATGNGLDKVVGRVLHLTDDELDAADEYAAGVYRRVEVHLSSGLTAWAYVSH